MQEQQFYDIYDFYYVPFWRETYFVVLVVCISILAAIGVGYFLFRWIRRNKKRKLLPCEWAEEELSKFDISKLSGKNEFKNFYFALTTIMKKYLSLRYDWKLEDKTGEEIKEFFSIPIFNFNLKDDFIDLLNSSLLIKFADEAAMTSQAERDLEVARKIIKRTRIQDK